MVHSAGTAENTRILENRESVHRDLAMGVIVKLNKGNYIGKLEVENWLWWVMEYVEHEKFESMKFDNFKKYC